MKAKDLMIGDYVQVSPSMMPIKIAATHQGSVAYYGSNILNWVREALLEPIELTPEILEKNLESESNIFGLQTYRLNENFNLENRGDRFCLVRKCNDYNSSTFWICDLVYLHQLQHALRFCEIEKEIDL